MNPDTILANILPLATQPLPGKSVPDDIPNRHKEDAKTKARRKAEKRSRKINRK